MRPMMFLQPAILLAAAVSLTAPEVSLGYQAGAVTNGGMIRGVVRFSGEYPPAETLEVTKDFDVCGNEQPAEQFVVSAQTKGLQNVVVSLANIEAGKPFTSTDAILDQKGCRYRPHVVLLPAGGTLEIRNEDGILHNIHTTSQLNTSINRAQPKFKRVLTETFSEPETIQVVCDVHNWMSAHIVVQAHPYYTLTGLDGTFELTDVPPGTYEIRAWHEVIGQMEKSVTVAGGETTEVSFEIAPNQ